MGNLVSWPFNDLLLAECAPSSEAGELEVIGAGLSRTGSVSLHAALTILGFGPCHHGAVLFRYPSQSVALIRALNGEPTDFRSIMRGYRSTVDIPLCNFVPELLAAFPNAKVVLSVRDSPEQWWQSMGNTVVEMSYPSYRISVWPVRYLWLWGEVVRLMLERKWDPLYGNSGRRVGIQNYTRHEAYIRRIVPDDQLLVFNVKEGWEPLCAFLDVPVPDVPFPRTNDTKEMRRNIRNAMLLGRAAWAGIGLAVVAGGYWIGHRV
ncbi:hypothetical protein CALCODRAFT_184342 [Calocera cornea HHB12733]|uniref:NAD dependent epimerase/dehydratase n=1 Tax=Calocera cornea HHB12733 TaxID=1353952 RepID=A0A165CAI6_9BASI|nr:hypothetical protein CALCODRAFT_184342 [Calocera cornea HHB12733]